MEKLHPFDQMVMDSTRDWHVTVWLFEIRRMYDEHHPTGQFSTKYMRFSYMEKLAYCGFPMCRPPIDEPEQL
jgi:hypothetical protein